jgi:hypothetical protein
MIRLIAGLLLLILFSVLAQTQSYDRLYAVGMLVAITIMLWGVSRTPRKSLGRVTGMRHVQRDYRNVKYIPPMRYSSYSDEYGSYVLEQ